MNSQRECSADELPTRRQLREAARAAEAGQKPPSSGPALTRRQIRQQERAELARSAESAQSPADGRSPAASGVRTDASPAGVVDSPTEPADGPVETVGSPAEPVPAVAEAAGSPAESVARPPETAADSTASTDASAAAGEPEGALAAALVAPPSAPTPAPWRRRPSGSLKRPARRWLPRLAVVGALGALTTVVPLTGAALPNSSSDPATGAPLAQVSALDVFSVGGTPVSTDASAALAADPLASLRSMVASSRGRDRTPTCVAGAMEANGVLASEAEMSPPEIMMPLTEGSFHYTSRYGPRALFGHYSNHAGLDLAAAAGTPIHAVAEGTVIHAGAGMDGRSSMLVIIEHEVNGEKFWSWYVHMYPNGVYVGEGQHVTAGEVIGAVGSYGNSTGPHLHLEIHVDEDMTTINPETWLASHATPLDSQTLQCTEG